MIGVTPSKGAHFLAHAQKCLIILRNPRAAGPQSQSRTPWLGFTMLTAVSRTLGRFVAAACCFAPLLVGGCNIIGPAYILVAGPPKTDALHTLEKEAKTVIFVDDQGSNLPRRSLRATISDRVERELMAQKVVNTLVASSAIQQVAMQDAADNLSDNATLGKAVGADLVVHVLVESFTMSPDNATYQPFASGFVRVVDARTGKRVWPAGEPNGYRLAMQLPIKRGVVPKSASELARAQEDLASNFGLAVSRLFYKHEARTERAANER